MQAQAVRQEVALAAQTSLQIVKTLLNASFALVAYVRNLLPDDNFGEGRLSSGDKRSGSSDRPGPSRNVSSIAIKTVKRGFSTEADKLLNYLEKGVFDAIERHYLKSFIFAVYLDEDDPNNVIEAYTYNITYFTDHTTGVTMPLLSLEAQLDNLSLSKSVLKQNTNTGPPTLGDVKSSLKALIKRLLVVTQSLEPLPKRRFATFKLFYRDHTPPNYEPPYFRPGDPEKDKFVSTTHSKTEVPEKFSVGSVITPHHGVDVKVQSVVKFIPTEEKNDDQFTGIVSLPKSGLGGFTSGRDSSIRAKQIDLQKKDAEDRTVAWRIEEKLSVMDADPDYMHVDSGICLLGTRQPDGNIVPMQEDDSAMESQSEAHFYGQEEVAPSHVGKLMQLRSRKGNGVIDPTQQLDETQQLEQSDAATTTSLQFGGSAMNGGGINTQDLASIIERNSCVMNWSGADEILDMETQTQPVQYHHDLTPTSKIMNMNIVPESPDRHSQSVSGSSVRSKRTMTTQDLEDEEVECPCEHQEGDDLIQCDGPCGKWMHLWCMGYHCEEDPRLPSHFVCIPCRLKGDINFALITDAYEGILSELSNLALFRRAIKFAEKENPSNAKEFRKVTGCATSLSDQLWKRLERENFIVLEVTETDSLGLIETRSKVKAQKPPTKKKGKNVTMTMKYIFNDAIRGSKEYEDYFYPDSDAEKSFLGLDKLGRKNRCQKVYKSRQARIGGNGNDVVEYNSLSSIDTSTLKSKPVLRSGAEDHDKLAGGMNERHDTTHHTDTHMESQTQDETQFVHHIDHNVAFSKGPGGPGGPGGGGDSKRKVASQELNTTGSSAPKKMKISMVDGVDIEE